MSEKKIRYFQAEDHVVARAMSSESQSRLAADPYYTEVQVVPVDAIVIRRDELPEVTQCDGSTGPTGAIRTVHGWSQPLGPSWHRDLARHQLALAEYQEEHPPVDEEQVKALNEIYEDWSQPHNYGIPFGQYLAERGVRVEAKS